MRRRSSTHLPPQCGVADRAKEMALPLAVLAAALSASVGPAAAGKTAPVLNGWNTAVQTPQAPKDNPGGGAQLQPQSAKTELAVKPQAEPSTLDPPAPAPAIAPAAKATAGAPAPPVDRVAARRNATSAGAKAAQAYCRNIADAAADARLARQKKTLATLRRELDERIDRLQAKTVEYRNWLAQRDEFARKAQGSLVLIYARMPAETAAQQLVAMDEATAASLLMKLKPRTASAMLNEMEPKRAARLASIIAGLANTANSRAEDDSAQAARKAKAQPAPQGDRR